MTTNATKVGLASVTTVALTAIVLGCVSLTGSSPAAAGPANPPSNHRTPMCTGSDISVSVGPRGVMQQGEHTGVEVHFTNTSDHSCFMTGYPGAATETPGGHQVQQAVRTMNGYFGGLPAASSVPTYTLQPGQYSTAIIEGTSTAQPGTADAGCDLPYNLAVTTPNTAATHVLPITWPGCTTLQIHPTELVSN